MHSRDKTHPLELFLEFLHQKVVHMLVRIQWVYITSSILSSVSL